MLALSQRAQKMPSSPIRRLMPLADAAKKAGKSVYHLNIGQPDIGTPKDFFKGVGDAPAVLAYSPSQGLLESRQALSAYYARHGVELTPEQIIVTAGGSEAVLFAILAVCNPGDEVLVPEPFYANYKSFAVLADVTLKPITTLAEEGFHLPPQAEIDARVTPKTRAILFCSPGNPTGAVYTREEMERLKAVALKHDLYLISDEVYREFVYDGLAHTSVFHLDGLDERAILVDSISKRFSACGARVGCIASRNKEVMGSALKFAQARLSPPALGELGMIRMLNAPDSEQQVRSMIERFQARRDVLYAGLKEVPGVVCRKPAGAFYVNAKLPVDHGEAFAKWMLGEFDVNGETVMLAPAADFYATPGLGTDEVRIAYVLKRESLKKALSILKAGLEAYAGSTVGAPAR
jgi:aspartate aminotransferase